MPVVFSAVLEACFLTRLKSRECKFVILFCDYFHYVLAVNMSLSGVDTQDFLPAPRPKRKSCPLQTPEGTSSSISTLNQFTILSGWESDTEDIGVHHNQTAVSAGFHLLSSTITLRTIPLKKVSEELGTPVDVRSQSHRLLLYTKSVTDCNVLLG